MEYKFVKWLKGSSYSNCDKCAFIHDIDKCNSVKCEGGYYIEDSVEFKKIEKLRDYIQSKDRDGALFEHCIKDMIKIIDED